METNEKLNDVLNDLIRINHDREEGYEKAIKQLGLNSDGLKKMFRSYAKDSRRYADALSAYVERNGGEPSNDSTVSGKIYRAWMEVKTAMSSKESESVLDSCEYGEDAAQKAYQQALNGDVILPSEIRDIVSQQKTLLRKAHDEVKRERDAQKVHH